MRLPGYQFTEADFETVLQMAMDHGIYSDWTPWADLTAALEEISGAAEPIPKSLIDKARGIFEGHAQHPLRKTFDPAEPRDGHGRWTGEGGKEHESGSGSHGSGAGGGMVSVGGGESVKVITDTELSQREGTTNSRAVSMQEFQQVATQGKSIMDGFKANASPPKGLTDNLDAIKASTLSEVQKDWGGATIDAHTGKALASDANAYAVTVKPPGTESVAIHENPSAAEWSHAVDTAVQRFGPTLANQQHYLGVFHDNALGRIDLDPVVVVSTRAQSDAIGAYTHAIGGAYNFADGNGYWAPHVVTTGKGVMAEIEKSEKPEWIKHFKGIGQWYSQAHAVSEHDHEKN